MLGKLLKAAVGTALLPVAVAVDVITIPVIANGDRESSTAKIGSAVIKNLEDAVKPEKKGKG